MRAVQFDRFGPPDVLRVNDVPAPRPGPGEVLVEVRAASVDAGETAFRAGRMRRVTRVRFPRGLGSDFAGRVAALGSGVRAWSVGDAVWGLMPHLTFGAIADYVAVPEQRLARAPQNLDLLEAAALPVVGTTAMTALSGKARLQPGERLLVRGATGGVGSVAVQLGKALGAHVTALAAARNLDWITRLGADEAVDYRTTRPEDLDRFDVIVDVVGTDLGAYRKRLARGGRLVALSFDSDRVVSSMLGIALRAAATPRRVKMFSNNPSADRIAELTRAVEAGTIRPVVDTVFPMRDIAAVHQRLEAGGVRGKYVVDLRLP
ncbi:MULTISPECIES: NAD(P)-dependent alcohol dehydrogenase [Streptomyces]|uniref:Oxidoreductase n=1 Tax=Streptomyces coelicolor (strain ATCC BAA-471 / A3(2) / M145) TaxID=100226 RepID=Q9ADD8_STRCO|nr:MULTISPECIES: NAD(P)-dependent alcohol dehydrogenase [Streptomyces]MDX3407658.1 NAD(P)-dependent alcohol dehydrogenase [Streptomyces sp. ME02-6977A]MYU44591.1 zinc-binding dehydrogenase [Streptomyces sp. SID7813]NSL78040.1 NAD(P)-dependent alcohol dehydrogenase [Streptomyces coelicolor]QFI44969.1 NAD(P)-dependent alcohol dehydrogenase [Streptomyces coelicolor A3(2)]QKN68582.1 NAD(P)-dependent alcohol dehydrogenase [Streptomyces coelicolor]